MIVLPTTGQGFMMRDWNSIAHPYSAKLKPKGDRLDLLF
jgi:hypothetical protein